MLKNTFCATRLIVFFLSIGREPTTRPENNCLQITVCSCKALFKRVLLQIIFCSISSNDRIKQLLNSVIAKYRNLPMSRRSIICHSLRFRQIIDLTIFCSTSSSNFNDSEILQFLKAFFRQCYIHEGLNGVNRLATNGENIYGLQQTKQGKNYRLTLRQPKAWFIS